MSNTWPPDWKNADHYKHVNEYTPSDICAWEFLRRNPEYQKDFAKYKKTRKSKNLPTPEEPYDFSDMCDWYGLDAKSKNFNPAKERGGSESRDMSFHLKSITAIK